MLCCNIIFLIVLFTFEHPNKTSEYIYDDFCVFSPRACAEHEGVLRRGSDINMEELGPCARVCGGVAQCARAVKNHSDLRKHSVKFMSCSSP